jgi:hypothetical protein
MTSENGQLSLIQAPLAWRLDEHTRAVGRAGVARARAALRDGARRRARGPAGPPPPRRGRPAAA